MSDNVFAWSTFVFLSILLILATLGVCRELKLKEERNAIYRTAVDGVIEYLKEK